jgi:signal transduction histidine kinase
VNLEPAPFSELILDHISTCVVTVDRHRRATFANKVARDLLRHAAPIVGRDVVAVFDGNAELAAALGEMPIGGERRLDFFLSRADGPPIEMGMTVVRARPGAPDTLAFALLFRDFVDLRQIEMEMRRMERLSALGKMIAGLSHEIRNPLTGLQFLAEALMGEVGSDDPRHGYAVRIQSLVGRIESLLHSCLQFSEPRPAEKRIVSAPALAEAIRGALGRTRKGRPVVEAEASLPSIEVDVEQVVESVLALVENALDATGDAARVQVRLRADSTPGLVPKAEHVLRIDVADDGDGMPPEQLALVCDPFYTTKEKGTGLGLSVAHALVRHNGGRMLIQSSPGAGSIFSLVFPA